MCVPPSIAEWSFLPPTAATFGRDGEKGKRRQQQIVCEKGLRREESELEAARELHLLAFLEEKENKSWAFDSGR